MKTLQEINDALLAEVEQLKRAVAIQEHSQQYLDSQTRFKTIFEASRLGNKIISSDLKILQVNESLVALLGYESKKDIIGTHILDYAPLECHQGWRLLQEELWEGARSSFSLETSLIKKDKSIMRCRVTSILFPDNGDTLGYTIIEDVTENYNLRIQNEDFISVASHELKTPVTSLKATIQLLARMLEQEPAVSDSMIKMASNAAKYTAKLGHLVTELLSTTTIEQGQLALNKTYFSIWDVINESCSHIELEGKYHIVYQGDKSLKVLADQHKIDQVLVNLVNNAVKYAPSSKEIMIRAERDSGMIKISVMDLGPGIAAENLPHLFERYYRAEKDNNQSSGLGLGLYIAGEIISRHGGKIGVYSMVNTGSTFWFTLPDVLQE